MTEQLEAAAPVKPSTAVTARRTALFRRMLRHTSARVGLFVLLLYLLLIVAGPFIVAGSASANINFQDLNNTLLPSSAHHWLGTDELGRDEAVRLVLGGRYTVIIGIGAVVGAIVVGVPLGAISGFYRGKVDLLIQRFVDILLSFPNMLLALALVAALGSGLVNLILAVGIASLPQFIRLVRASALSVSQLPHVEVATALGVTRWRILWRHVVPNSMTPVIVQAPLALGNAILTGAALGFLGLGVQQPTPEWGSMMGDSRSLIFGHAMLVTAPGILIAGLILAFNLVGDGLRDVIDPRLRSRTRHTTTDRRRRRIERIPRRRPFAQEERS